MTVYHLSPQLGENHFWSLTTEFRSKKSNNVSQDYWRELSNLRHITVVLDRVLQGTDN
jgi:hypothetical protein